MTLPVLILLGFSGVNVIMGCFSLKRRYEKHEFLGVIDDFGVETIICI